MRHRVQLQRSAKTPDGGGGNVKTWNTYATVYGFLQPLTGTEPTEGQHPMAKITHELTLHYRAGVLPDDRVLYGSRPMQIRQILNMDERGRRLRLQLEEGVAT
jgi:SPP1 family predicted phage head-tail adaptor